MTSGLVIDNSISLAWYFADEAGDFTDALLERLISEPTWVPSLWALEFVNALQVAQRRGRVNSAQRLQILEKASQLPFMIDREKVTLGELDQLAQRYQLTAYDAAYLELAIRRSVPLATRDRALIRAARAAGHPVETDSPP